MLLIAVVGSGPALYLGWCVKTGSELDRERTAAAKYGLIKTSAEINGAPVPAAENAAFDYFAAERARTLLPKTDTLLVDVIADKAEEEREEALKAVGLPVMMGQKDVDRACLAYAPVLSYLRQGAKKPRLNYGRKWENPWAAPFPSIRRLGQVLGVDAIRLARGGLVDEALENLEAIRKMAAHHFQEPYLPSMEVGLQLETEATSRATTLAWLFREDSASFAKIRAFLEAEPKDFEFTDCLPVDILSWNWAVDQMARDPKTLGLHDEDLVFELQAYRLAGFRQREQAGIVRICRETYERYHGMGRDFIAMIAKLKELDPDTATTWAFNDVIESHFLPMPDYTYTIQTGAAHQVRNRLAIAGALLIESYGKTGRFPEKLPEVPAMIDPLSGEPFKYIVKNGKCALYSVGLDGKNGEPDEYTKAPSYSPLWTRFFPPNDLQNLGAPKKTSSSFRE